MIAKMDQITVVGCRKDAPKVLVSLQSLGVVQLDPLEVEDSRLNRLRLEGDDRADKEGWEAVVARSGALLDVLNASDVQGSGRWKGPSALSDINEHLEAVGSQVDELVAERAELADTLDVIDTFLPTLREVAPYLALFENSNYLYSTALSVPSDMYEKVSAALSATVEERLLLASIDQGRNLLVVLVGLKADLDKLRGVINRSGLSELGLPDDYGERSIAKAVHMMEEQSRTFPRQYALIGEKLSELANEQGGRLRAMHTIASNNSNRLGRLEDMVQGRYGFALQGWVPSSERVRVAESLKKQYKDELAIESRAADQHHDQNIPVLLDNPSWVKPFQGLLALFSPPKYGSFDPSWTLAVFFPFFFGLVVGDIGFSLMFAGIGLFLRRRGRSGRSLSLGPLGIVIPVRALAPISTVIYWCAGWGALFGFLFGEFFGNFLERFPIGQPVFYTNLHHEAGYGLIPIALFRVEVFTPILLVSLAFGVLQVLAGWAIRVIYGIKHNDMRHVYEGVGMFSGLLALVIFATSFLTGNINPVVTGLVLTGLLIFIVATVLARMPLMLLEIFSNSGHILSYLRIFAVGLSAALVANLATDLGFAIGGSLPIIGPILGILVGLSVHLIAIALTIIGHTLQPLRLQYVEFFTKFGFYDESGRPYRPFRLLGGNS